MLLRGGRGGRGNASFKTSRNTCAPLLHSPVLHLSSGWCSGNPQNMANHSEDAGPCAEPSPACAAAHMQHGMQQAEAVLCRAPQLAEVGERGPEAWLELELRLVADVGLVGAPNAGKSTLLGTLSAAQPKIADYPFTTLVPNLGVCDLDFRSIVLADIPGAPSERSRAW